MSESLVLCEGYHDRAFWAGWLRHLGCSDQGFRPGTRGYPRPDPWGIPIRGGHFAYASLSNAFLRVVSCGGRGNILRDAEARLRDRATKALLRLVINIDPDVSAAGTGSQTGLRHQDVEHFVRQRIDPSATVNTAGEIEIDAGATRIALVRWEVSDPPNPALPDQQTLERLVCSAMVAAYPARGQPVADWLASRPSPPPPNPKEHSWSYMAGWASEHGCEFFYSNLWNDAAIVGELETQLRATGAWQIAERLAQ
jgi:hypothetical protein